MKKTGFAIDIDQISSTLHGLRKSKAWKKAVSNFKGATRILYLGHGGNLALAQHAAIDCTRITNGEKFGYAPGSGTEITSWINDVGWEKWLQVWATANIRGSGRPNHIIVITSTGASPDILHAIDFLLADFFSVTCFTCRPIKKKWSRNGEFYNEVVLSGISTYHDAEMLTLGLTYDLLTAAGFRCPKIKM